MNRNSQKLAMQKMIKRIGITVLCCLPILILLGYFLQELNSVATVAIFVVVMLVAVCVEEYIYAHRQTKQELKKKLLHKDEDVYK